MTPGSSRTYGQAAAEFVGKQLKGRKTEWAGDDLNGKPRRFGVLCASNFNIEYRQQLQQRGVTLSSETSYPVPADQARPAGSAGEIDQQMPTMIARLKGDGVTTLIMMANNTAAGSAARQMKAQEWYPEIVETSFPYTDLDILARSFDQDAWSLAVRARVVPPLVEEGYIEPIGQAFQWYWGTDKGTRWQEAFASLAALYSVIQYGPDVEREEHRRDPGPAPAPRAGVGARTARALTLENPPRRREGGHTSRCCAGLVEPRRGRPGQLQPRGEAAGKWMYLDDAQRYIAGTFPTKKQPFFDEAASIPGFDTVPASEPKWPTYPCKDCPSSGNTDVVPAAAEEA